MWGWCRTGRRRTPGDAARLLRERAPGRAVADRHAAADSGLRWFVGKACARLDGRLQDAGFDEAMRAALAAEPVLAADETPVNVLTLTLTQASASQCPGLRKVMVIHSHVLPGPAPLC